VCGCVVCVCVERERERKSICSLIAAMTSLRALLFLPLFFTLSTFYTVFFPLHYVVHSGVAFCDRHHSMTPLPEHIGFGGSVALTVGRHIVSIAIRMQSRV